MGCHCVFPLKNEICEHFWREGKSVSYYYLKQNMLLKLSLDNETPFPRPRPLLTYRFKELNPQGSSVSLPLTKLKL